MYHKKEKIQNDMKKIYPLRPVKRVLPIFGFIKLIDLLQAIKPTLIHSTVIVPYSKIPAKMHPNSPHFQPLQKNCIAVNGTEIVQYSKSATARFKTKIVVGQDLCNPNLYHMDFLKSSAISALTS